VQEHRIIKNIVFRLVRRHIAGSTMNSALNAVRHLNGKGMDTTLTFLSEHVNDPIKARYNANNYVQMIRQLSRLHLNSSVSVRLSQLGFALGGTGSPDRLLDEVLDAASASHSTVWLESGLGVTNDELMAVYRDRRGDLAKLGVEVPISYYGNMDGIAKMIKPNDMVRITSHQYMAERKPARGAKADRNTVKRYMGAVGLLLKKSAKVCIHESDEKLVTRIVAGCNGYKKDLIFGVPFGYNTNRVSKLMKMKVRLDVYVPYGKDWTNYAVYGLAGARLRSIATPLFYGKNHDGLDGG
jgi:proline dehydrogenase